MPDAPFGPADGDDPWDPVGIGVLDHRAVIPWPRRLSAPGRAALEVVAGEGEPVVFGAHPDAREHALLAARAAHKVVPSGVPCCGMAGDRGMRYPELTGGALQHLDTNGCSDG